MNCDKIEWQIKVLNGPLRDATFKLHERLSLGRAGSSDIQIVHDGVSRQHAQIVLDEHGQHILVDLDSSNGTFVNGNRIRRHRLERGQVFKIMRLRFRYEQIERQPTIYDDPGVFSVRLTNLHTLRGTVGYGETDLPVPAAGRERTTTYDTPIHRPPEDSRPSATARGEERHQVVATRPDGSIYEDDLIGDIVSFRALRARSRRGGQISRQDREQIARLESRLKLPSESSDQAPRTFGRFTCHCPARLRLVEGEELAAAVLDIGIDGAKLVAYGHSFTLQTTVWLTIDVVSEGSSRTVVFTGRVAWIKEDRVGLVFAGIPAFEGEGKPTPRALAKNGALLGRVSLLSRRSQL